MLKLWAMFAFARPHSSEAYESNRLYMAKKTFFMSVMFFVYSAICFFIFIDQIWTALTFTISSQYAFAAEVRMPPELLLSPTYLVRNPVVVAVQLRLTPSLLGGGGTEVLAIMLEDFFFQRKRMPPLSPFRHFSCYRLDSQAWVRPLPLP